MKEMSAGKVQKFVDYLDATIDKLNKERERLFSENRSELSYHCRLQAEQTEIVKQQFEMILNESDYPLL